ncbi:MAG: energy transducer TonB [Candidatus Eremiobacteraeota bacterium]|nr:energy transducer TonB [Candidatus Eremiobacteraeota bacterium]
MIGSVALTMLAAAAAAPSATPLTDPCFHNARITKAVIPDTDRLWGTDYWNMPLAAVVAVTIGADGSVKSVSIAKTSGSIEFDRDVVLAAKRSTYSPKVVRCEPVEATVPFMGTRTPGTLP